MSLEAAVDNLAKVADYLVDRLNALTDTLRSFHDLQREALRALGPPAPPPGPAATPGPAETRTKSTLLDVLETIREPVDAPSAPATPPPTPNAAPPAATKAARNAEATIKASIEAMAPAEPAALDYARDVQPALLRLAAKKGRQALVDLLKAHGVSKGADLPTANYPAVVGAVTLALAEAAS
jgi:hypothetical protein